MAAATRGVAKCRIHNESGLARGLPCSSTVHDVRQIDPVLVMGVAALSGGVLVIEPWPLAVSVAGACWICRRRLHPWVVAVATLLALLGAGRAVARLTAVETMRQRAESALSPPRRCGATFDVISSPIVLTSSDAPRGRRARIDVRVVDGTCGADLEPLPEGLALRLYQAPESATRGARMRGVVDVGAARRFDNPGGRHPLVAEALRGVVATGVLLDGEIARPGTGASRWIDRARAHVRARIEGTFAPSVTRHARALVLGEYDMPDEEQRVFRVSGLAHLLAVSGTHLILAVLAVGRLLRVLLARIGPLARRMDVGRISAAFCVGASWLYADFAGGGGSAYRAAAMLSVAMLARALGRRPAASRAFAWSLVGGALAEPLAAHDLSFGLSVAATTGLLCWGRLVVPAGVWWRQAAAIVAGAARATAAANLACLPILLMINADLPLLGVAANLLAAPVGELAALPVCLAHTMLWWARPAEHGAAVVGSGALEVVRAVAHSAAEAGFVLHLPPPTPWQLATIAVVALAVWSTPAARRRRRVLIGLSGLLTLGALELHATRAGAPQGVLRVTALDVAQGDAILVDLPDGRGMLVDGGGLVGSPIDTGERAVLEVLRFRRRRHLEVVVLSHPHPDHYGGLLTVLARMPVGELWVSGLATATRPESELSRAIVVARARGTVVRDARELCGAARRFGAARVDVLGPCPTFDTAASANDNSLVLRVALGRRVALLTGDAEAHQEAQILAKDPTAVRADLLKVGHHGSRTSTTLPWLSAVAPSVAMISCGVRNRFGHPHAVTLESLLASGVQVLRTDRGGAVTWQTDGEAHRFHRRRSPWSESR